MSKVIAFEAFETIGFSIINPCSCIKVTGPVEFLEALVNYLENEKIEDDLGDIL